MIDTDDLQTFPAVRGIELSQSGCSRRAIRTTVRPPSK
jgi:hypothetical protein